MNACALKVSVGLTSVCLAILGFPPLLTANSAGAQTLPVSTSMSRAPYDRIRTPQLRPRHIRTFGLRADRVGDTPSSSRYFQIRNITALVGGSSGAAYAVNNDGRIAYTDFLENGLTAAYIVNNSGAYAKLVAPRGARRATSYGAYALNEKAEVVGGFESAGADAGYIAWTLSGALGSSVAYWGIGGGEFALNNHEIGVGWSGVVNNGYAAALFDGLSTPSGKTIGLRGLRGNCSDGLVSAINDAGEMVGDACNDNTAVRYSLSGYAQPLPITPAGLETSAFGINQQGDVVGQAGSGAYLLRGGKTIHLPLPKGSTDLESFTALSVNATDEVVGTLCTNYYGCVGFLYTNGRTYDLNALVPPNSGWHIVDAVGINDRGEVVGDGYYNGSLCGFSLKPPHL